MTTASGQVSLAYAQVASTEPTYVVKSKSSELKESLISPRLEPKVASLLEICMRIASKLSEASYFLRRGTKPVPH